MNDKDLAENYIKTAISKAIKLETEIIVILSALILIWVSMENVLPEVKKEVYQYNGYQTQAKNISEQIRDNRFALDTVRMKIDTITSVQTKKDLQSKEERIRISLIGLRDRQNEIKRNVSKSHSQIEFQIPIIGEIKGPYFLSTVICNSLILVFISYLFRTREKLFFYYYNALIILQKDKTNKIDRDLALTFPRWCLPFRKPNDVLSLSTLTESFGKKSTKSIDNYLYPALIFGIVATIAFRSIYLSFWIINDLKFTWWYWIVLVVNMLTFATIIYLCFQWFSGKKVNSVHFVEGKNQIKTAEGK